MKRFMLVCVLIFCVFNLFAETTVELTAMDGDDWIRKTPEIKRELVRGMLMTLGGCVIIIRYQFEYKNPSLREFQSFIALVADVDEAVKKIDAYYANGNRSHIVLLVLLCVYDRWEFSINEL